MSEQKETSSAVRITRIVAPTVLIIALALIFKSEIGSSLQGGCFEISLELAGLDFSDQSLCNATDVNEFANNMTQAGATVAEQQADSAFKEFETALTKLTEENNQLVTEVHEIATKEQAIQNKIFSYARELEALASRSRSATERAFLVEHTQKFIATFNVPPSPNTGTEETPTVIEPINPQQVHNMAEGIKTRYVQRAQIDVEAIQNHVKVEVKK